RGPGEWIRRAEDDLRLPHWARARADPRLRRGGARGEPVDRRRAPRAVSLRLRRRGSLSPPCRSRAFEAADRTVPGDAVRVAALLSVRARGGLARARVWERVVRPFADDPARLASRGDGATGAGAGAGLEAPLRLRCRADAGALLPRGQMVARGAVGRPGGGFVRRRG